MLVVTILHCHSPPLRPFLSYTGVKQQHPSWCLYGSRQDNVRATLSADANYPNFIYSSGVLGVFYQIRMWTLTLIMCREKTHHFKLHYETSATLARAWKISEFPFNDLEDYVQQERRSGKSVINVIEYFLIAES